MVVGVPLSKIKRTLGLSLFPLSAPLPTLGLCWCVVSLSKGTGRSARVLFVPLAGEGRPRAFDKDRETPVFRSWMGVVLGLPNHFRGSATLCPSIDVPATNAPFLRSLYRGRAPLSFSRSVSAAPWGWLLLFFASHSSPRGVGGQPLPEGQPSAGRGLGFVVFAKDLIKFRDGGVVGLTIRAAVGVCHVPAHCQRSG